MPLYILFTEDPYDVCMDLSDVNPFHERIGTTYQIDEDVVFERISLSLHKRGYLIDISGVNPVSKSREVYDLLIPYCNTFGRKI